MSQNIIEALAERILVIDGAMGTQLQACNQFSLFHKP